MTVSSRLSGRDSDLEAFSHNPSDGSFASLAYSQARKPAVPLVLSREGELREELEVWEGEGRTGRRGTQQVCLRGLTSVV